MTGAEKSFGEFMDYLRRQMDASAGIPADVLRGGGLSIPCLCRFPAPDDVTLPELFSDAQRTAIAVPLRPMRTGDMAGTCPECGTSYMVSRSVLEWRGLCSTSDSNR